MRVDEQALHVCEALGIEGAIVIGIRMLPGGALDIQLGQASKFALSPALVSLILAAQLEQIAGGAAPELRSIQLPRARGD